MYFLTEPVEVDERVPTVAKYLNRAYLGFTRISDATVDAILNQFGSTDEFVHQKLNGPQGGIDTMGV